MLKKGSSIGKNGLVFCYTFRKIGGEGVRPECNKHYTFFNDFPRLIASSLVSMHRFWILTRSISSARLLVSLVSLTADTATRDKRALVHEKPELTPPATHYTIIKISDDLVFCP